MSQDDDEARLLKSTLPIASVADRASYIKWNAMFLRDTASKMAGVTGMHVMPVTASGLSMTDDVLRMSREE